MPIVRDGEKYACKQCIQGHRVSGCNHTDRPLLHVNKKGRPVSQCPHCRGLRKARQTHVKCDCGEKRHSRNNSSESASLDEGGCSCYLGKKCTCALKKEPQDDKNGSNKSPRNDRSSPMHWIPARRSESAIPSIRNAAISAMHKRHGSQDLGVPFPTQQPYQLGRASHAAQRSVDSLPLASYATSQYQVPAPNYAYDTQYLTPDTALQHLHPNQPMRSPFGDQLVGDFPVHLDQTTIERTLSPHNTKRYSMNDFSILPGMSHQFSDQQLFPQPVASESAHFPFPDLSNQDFRFPSGSVTNEQHPRVNSITSTEAPFPALSRSSSGTGSEPIEWAFGNSDGKSDMPQPMITIDPSWNFQTFDGSETSAYEYTPSSYQGTPSDYTSPLDDPTLPSYRVEHTHEDLNPFSTEPRFGGGHNFPFLENEGSLGQEKLANMAHFQVLPDRSTQLPPSSESLLDAEFKFPVQDLSAMDFAGSPLKQGWSPHSDGSME